MRKAIHSIPEGERTYVCGICGGTWMNNACLDCGTTLGMIAQAADVEIDDVQVLGEVRTKP